MEGSVLVLIKRPTCKNRPYAKMNLFCIADILRDPHTKIDFHMRMQKYLIFFLSSFFPSLPFQNFSPLSSLSSPDISFSPLLSSPLLNPSLSLRVGGGGRRRHRHHHPNPVLSPPTTMRRRATRGPRPADGGWPWAWWAVAGFLGCGRRLLGCGRQRASLAWIRRRAVSD